MEKKRTDELEYAQLLKDNVPAAPIYSGLDGGINKAFLAQFSRQSDACESAAVCILSAATATDRLG